MLTISKICAYWIGILLGGIQYHNNEKGHDCFPTGGKAQTILKVFAGLRSNLYNDEVFSRESNWLSGVCIKGIRNN